MLSGANLASTSRSGRHRLSPFLANAMAFFLLPLVLLAMLVTGILSGNEWMEFTELWNQNYTYLVNLVPTWTVGDPVDVAVQAMLYGLRFDRRAAFQDFIRLQNVCMTVYIIFSALLILVEFIFLSFQLACTS